MKLGIRNLPWSLLSVLMLSAAPMACSHGAADKADSDAAVTEADKDKAADAAAPKAVADAHTAMDKTAEKTKTKAKKVIKRTQAAADKTAAAVAAGTTPEGSDEEYLADVDAAMGDSKAAPIGGHEEMNAATSTAINSEAHENTDADNSRVNRLNGGEKGLTAFQQGNSKSDVEITRKIRRSLTSNKNLSTYAQNVKIITRDGRVIVKGPVRSADERKIIEEAAINVAGAENVTSGLEIKAN